jgi:hypothetical protein
MKKIFLTVAAIFAFGLASAQNGKFKAGVNLGLPLGDIKDSYTMAIGVDASYMWSVSDKFQAGITTGYSHYLGDSMTVLGTKFDIDDAGFIPVAGSLQFSVTDNVFLGADLGYAIGMSPDGNDGGFLYQPKLGYQTDKIEVYGAYKGIEVDGGTFSSINLGINFKF